jgi:enoyl-CoA hydratase/carnithine racemase
MADLETTRDGAVGVITLNRPERKNAFTMAMIDDWTDALEAFQHDDGVRAIVLTGAGGAFCSGVDLSEFKGEARSVLEEKRILTDRVHKVARAMHRIDKPVIAAVDGAAVGAGMDMALLCDMRFASTSAVFIEGYIHVGLVPGDGGAWLLPRIVGQSTALRLLWTGDPVDAEEAKRLRLVEDVFPADSLLEETMRFAQRLAARPPIAVRMIKRAVRQGATHDLETSLDLISSHMAVVTSTNDSIEAFAAFKERRPGVYVGS